MATPPYAQALATNLGQNSIVIFAESDFAGEQATVNNAHQQSGAVRRCADNMDDQATSLRWNLAPGLLVVLFEDPDGKGDQLALWGKGQIPDLNKVDFNDQAVGRLTLLRDLLDRLPDTQLPYPHLDWPKLTHASLTEQFGVLKPIPSLPVPSDKAT